MNPNDDNKVDPDPFLLAALCLQSAAVILQLVQISRDAVNTPAKSPLRAVNNSPLQQLETALDDFDQAIVKAERIVRRSTVAPEKEFYEVSFMVSVGAMKLTANNVKEYHDAVADTTAKLAAITRWVGHIISQNTIIAEELGRDIVKVVNNSDERLNALMKNGAPIEAVMTEAKLVRDACRVALANRLDNRSNV